MSEKEKFCGHFYMSVYQDNGNTRRYAAFPLRCKSWDCPECRKVKARQYKARIKGFFEKPKLFFYTLTYYHNVTPEIAWSTYNESWNRLRTNLRKQYGAFEYIRVLESHKTSPYPHLHIICDKWFPPSKFGLAVVAAGFGYQIDAKPITSEGAGQYISKYLTKEWSNEKAWNLRKKYRCRIISFSSGLLSRKTRGGVWSLVTRGCCLDECIESIRCDYLWRTDTDAKVTHEAINLSNAEITVVFEPVSTGP
jgi:hypothetical protein